MTLPTIETNDEIDLTPPDWVNRPKPKSSEQTTEDASPGSVELRSESHRMKRGTAVVLAAILGAGGGTVFGLVLADHYGAPHEVKSVFEQFQAPHPTPGYAEGDINVINRGIHGLGLPPHQDSVIDNIGPNPQPGQWVKVEELKSPVFGGITIEASDSQGPDDQK